MKIVNNPHPHPLNFYLQIKLFLHAIMLTLDLAVLLILEVTFHAFVNSVTGVENKMCLKNKTGLQLSCNNFNCLIIIIDHHYWWYDKSLIIIIDYMTYTLVDILLFTTVLCKTSYMWGLAFHIRFEVVDRSAQINVPYS